MTLPAPENSTRLKSLFNILGPFLGLLMVFGLFAVLLDHKFLIDYQHWFAAEKPNAPTFIGFFNLKTMLTQTVIVAVAALGMTIIIVSGGIDLSVGSAVALTGVAGATLMTRSVSPVLVVLCTVLVGGGLGLLNGGLIAGLRMMPFIVTLGSMGVARGLAKWLSGSQTVNYPDTALNNLMAVGDPDRLFPLPPGVWVIVGLAVATSVFMSQTVFGRHIFAIGSNEATARLCGIKVQPMKVLIYGLAGLFFGLAGLMQLSRLTQGDPSAAVGLELDVIAAVVIGGASLSGGTGTILGSMIGALIMAVLRNGSSQMGWPTYTQEIIIGIVIILAVGLDKLRQRKANQS